MLARQLHRCPALGVRMSSLARQARLVRLVICPELSPAQKLLW